MIARLHYITQDVPGVSHAQLASLACLGGVKWVQLRVKDKDEARWKSIALETLQVCRKHGAMLIINDHARLAAEIGADGVHLGKQDMPVEEARNILGSKSIIGSTANTLADIERIEDTSADYIGLGPFRFTQTKKDLSPVLGLEGITALLAENGTEGLPIIAIGGIRLGDVQDLIQSGVHGIAVSSAINQSVDPSAASRQFLLLLKKAITQKAG